MIRRKTVLVLGAGASNPYGYPLGAELRQHLIQELVIGDNPPSHPLTILRSLDFADEMIRDFRAALWKSGTGSIDDFLEHRPEFIPVGKTAIADLLIRKENPGILFDAARNWYQHLFKHLNCRFEEFGENALAIVTFNYDRSLEEFLYQVLQNRYGKDPQLTAEAVMRIPIVHVHGSLGNLPWQASDGRPYASDLSLEQIRSAASSIKIIHENGGDDSEFRRASDLLTQASHIVFLGFGYHETNLDRLFSKEGKLNGPGIYGSFLGFTDLQRTTIQSRFSKEYKGNLQGAGEFDCLEFLRQQVVLE